MAKGANHEEVGQRGCSELTEAGARGAGKQQEMESSKEDDGVKTCAKRGTSGKTARVGEGGGAA